VERNQTVARLLDEDRGVKLAGPGGDRSLFGPGEETVMEYQSVTTRAAGRCGSRALLMTGIGSSRYDEPGPQKPSPSLTFILSPLVSGLSYVVAGRLGLALVGAGTRYRLAFAGHRELSHQARRPPPAVPSWSRSKMISYQHENTSLVEGADRSSG
jgi:hypothetical protein